MPACLSFTRAARRAALLFCAMSCAMGADAQTRQDATVADVDSLQLVVHHGQPYVVLSDDVEDAWSSGPVTLLSRAEPIVTRRAATSAIPAAFAAWRRREVTLYDSSTSRCTGRVTRLFVLNRVYPTAETVEAWDGDTDGDGAVDAPRSTDTEVAEHAFGLAPDSALLVGLVERLRGRCDGAMLAVSSRAVGPAVFTRDTVVSADLRARAVAFLRAQPHWQTLQSEYASYGDAVPHTRWDELPHAVTAVHSFRDGHTGRHVIFAIFDATPDGCGDMFSGRLWAWLDVRDDELVPIGAAGSDPGMDPVSVFDVSHDGQLTTPVSNGLVRMNDSGAFERVISTEIPSLDCPC